MAVLFSGNYQKRKHRTRLQLPYSARFGLTLQYERNDRKQSFGKQSYYNRP